MLREFFSKYLAECIVNNNKLEATRARDLWRKYVKEGTETYKEMVLSKTLLETKFSNAGVAQKFMDRVSENAEKINAGKLEKEKTAFIREINSTVGPDMFGYSLGNYTNLASVHVVLTEWINGNMASRQSLASLKNISKVEDKVLDYLCEDNSQETVDNKAAANLLLERNEKTVDGLVISIMHEKLNAKYSGLLTGDQKKILQQFVFSNDSTELQETLKNLREETIVLIEAELGTKLNTAKAEELGKIKTLLEEDYKDVSEINDTNVVFYMTVSKLNDDLKDEEK